VELRADALAAEADAFVPKGAPGDELLAALRAAERTPGCARRPLG
jgi:hypothetical protein